MGAPLSRNFLPLHDTVVGASRPDGLRSLWEIMLKRAALEFGEVVSGLTQLELRCERALATKVERDNIIDNTVLLSSIEARKACERGRLTNILADLDRFDEKANNKAPIIDIKYAAEYLRNRILDELEKELYFQVNRADARLYKHKALFGSAVAKKFKKSGSDIQNAGNCLALQQPTACVFHLMRAMESAVLALGARLKIKISPQSTWRQITGNMDDKIKMMPEKTARQKAKKHAWEEARTNLHHVGSVWRNRTMHPAATYTQSQATEVLNATRVFMNCLCDL